LSAEPRIDPVAAARPASRGSLLAILGVAFGVAAGVGNAIGGGILRTPGIVASHLPFAAGIVGIWMLAGLYCLLIANIVVELATMMPQAGGPYVFIRRALGGFWGFVFGWADWALQASGIAFLAVAFGEYAVQVWPGLPVGDVVVAVAAIAVLVALNMVGLRLGSGMQQALSLAKVVGYLGVVAACLLAPTSASSGAAAAAPSPPVYLAAALMLPAFFLSWQLAQETYSGYDGAIYFSEESRDASRNIPRAIFCSVFVTSAVYLLILVATLHVLTPAQISGSKLALADAASVTLGSSAGRWVMALSLVSLLGTINVSVLQASRILFAIGRDGLFTRRATAVNSGGTPSVATLITAVVAILLTSTGSFELLYTITAFLGVTITIGYISSFFVLRRREPATPRPYRALGYPWLPAFTFAMAAALWLGSLYANPRSALYGLALVACAYPAYRYALSRSRPR